MSVRRTAVALVGAALLFSGCSDDPEPRFQPPPSPSPSESETSAEPEAQTPEEFIREWFEAGTEMQNSGDTSAFLAMSDDCDPCEAFAADVEGVYEAGGYIRIGSERVIRVEPHQGAYLVEVKASPTEYRESEDSKAGSFPGGVNTYQITLRKSGGSWLLADYLDRT